MPVTLKRELKTDVLTEARHRIRLIFDQFERICVSFSGGKDSSVLLHLVMEEARRRDRKVALLFVDLEGQYRLTVDHVRACFRMYADHVHPFWICLPLRLRNATSNFEPRWTCWDPQARELWVRPLPPESIHDEKFFPFFQPGLEFEEFVTLFSEWYAQGKPVATFIGIRTDESFNRFRAIVSRKKQTFRGLAHTTRTGENVYNIYPIYDWKVADIWLFHHRFPALPYNRIYDCMHQAGLKPSQMRLCQPFGDDQRRGLWLFHVLEPDAWGRLLSRVAGANSGALYSRTRGNVTGSYVIAKPEGHTWKSFCDLLLASLPEKTGAHYRGKFRTFIGWWEKRGYPDGIPDEADPKLESKKTAPSYRRLCKAILRNDYWCTSLSFSPPRSAAYEKFLELARRETRHDRMQAKAKAAAGPSSRTS